MEKILDDQIDLKKISLMIDNGGVAVITRDNNGAVKLIDGDEFIKEKNREEAQKMLEDAIEEAHENRKNGQYLTEEQYKKYIKEEYGIEL